MIKLKIILLLLSCQTFASDLIFKNSFENKALILGTASGITSSGLSLNLNVSSSNEILSVNDNGSFIFILEVDIGDSYEVSILSFPSSQSCTLTNATGTVTSLSVRNIIVTCGDANNNWNQMNWDNGIWN